MPGRVLADSGRESGSKPGAGVGREPGLVRAVTERNPGRPLTQARGLKDVPEVSQELSIPGVGEWGGGNSLGKTMETGTAGSSVLSEVNRQKMSLHFLFRSSFQALLKPQKRGA